LKAHLLDSGSRTVKRVVAAKHGRGTPHAFLAWSSMRSQKISSRTLK
jgi:hypothetical protein